MLRIICRNAFFVRTALDQHGSSVGRLLIRGFSVATSNHECGCQDNAKYVPQSTDPFARFTESSHASRRFKAALILNIVNQTRNDQISVWRGPRIFVPEIWSENVDEAVRCLSAASFGPRNVFASNLGSGRMSGSPFLW